MPDAITPERDNSQEIIARIAALSSAPPERFPAALQPVAVAALLDTLAVAVAGSADAGTVALRATLEALDSTDARIRYSAADTAILLGFSSHVLDYDDVSMLCVCHPSAPVLSALIAFATSRRAPHPITGTAFLNAYCAGVNVLVRIGEALGFAHYQLGFHPTATLGPLGAAAAVSALLHLEQAQCQAALSMAASMSGGLKKNFGSAVKPLHVGLAAANGLRAALMAQAGLTATANALEGKGFLHAFSGGKVDYWPQGQEIEAPFVILDPGFEAKRYPCCYLLHKVIEAVLQLRREASSRAEMWTHAEVHVPAGSLEALIHPYPTNGLTAKFSIPYVVAAAWLDGRIDLRSFEDSAVARPDVQGRLHDVRVTEVGSTTGQGGDIGRAPVEVALFWPDGSSARRRITAMPGSAEDPLTPGQRKEKWLDCLRVGRPDWTAGKAAAQLDAGRQFAGMNDVRPWLQELMVWDG